MKPYLRLILAAALMSTPVLAQDAKGPRTVLTVQQDWTKAVGAHLHRRGSMAVARGGREGIEGRYVLKIGFDIAPDGAASNIRILESSGDEAVDNVALGMPALASPFPAFTPDMKPTPQSIVAPLELHFAPPKQADEASAGTLFITCDNGLRCVRLPCPNSDTILLPSGERLAKTAPDLDALSQEDRERLQEKDGLYYGTVVLEGERDGDRLVAKRVVRDATAEETALCRPRAE